VGVIVAEFREDNFIYPTMIDLSACLCTEIEASGLPGVCSCGPIVGTLVLDYCSNCGDKGCSGQAWVRLVDAFPSVDFPSPVATPQNCNAPMAYTIEIGIVRCKPLGTNTQLRGFVPPTMEQNVDALRLQTADIAAIRRAIQCCFGAEDKTYQIGTYTAAPPDGDCLGGYFNIVVWAVN
jgi:hypothetical protein